MTAAVRFVSLAVCFVAFAGCDVVEIAAQSQRARGMFERTLRSLVAEYAEESEIDEEIADLRAVLAKAQ